MPLRAIKLFYTVAFYPVSRARLRAAPVTRASPRFLSREGGRSAISTPFANLNSLSLAALIATPGGTRKLVLHRVKCLLSLSLFVSSFSFREILSLSLSRYRMAIQGSRARVLYHAFIVVLEAFPLHFSRVYCVGCVRDFTTNRRLPGRVVWASLQPRLVRFDEFSQRQCCRNLLLLSVNGFYELIAAVYQGYVISALNRNSDGR